MPRVVEYLDVLARMASQHLQCLYHNSGAWGFAPNTLTFRLGWIGTADRTIRPEALRLTRPVPPPYEMNLAELAVRFWRERLEGPLWVMPKSHWSYELQFGSREWLPDVLRQIGIDPDQLHSRNNGAAIEFLAAESPLATHLLRRLLESLLGGDFSLAFPGHPVVCTLHHHKQLWWVTSDSSLAAHLETMVPVPGVE